MLESFETTLNKILENYNFISKIDWKNDSSIQIALYDERFKHLINIVTGCVNAENEQSIIYVATQLGSRVGGSDYNRGLFERLKQHKDKADAINNFYSGCSFVSNIRLNTFKTNLWFTTESFSSLENYIELLNKIKITRSRVPKQQCINDLNNRNAKGQFQKLKQYHYRSYHWLEFLAIYEQLDKIEDLNFTIQKHIHGMEIIKKARSIRHRKK